MTQGDPERGILAALVRSTRGRWEEQDGEGGRITFASTKHLVVRQNQNVHTQLQWLFDDLRSDEQVVQMPPALELRVYTAPDTETAVDLKRSAPIMLSQKWDPQGSIHQVGKSLIVNQTSAFHEWLDEIMKALEQSTKRSTSSAPTTTSNPAGTLKDDSAVGEVAK